MEALNVVTCYQYVVIVVLYIEITELITDDSEIPLIFAQLQEIIMHNIYQITYQ